MGKYLYTVPLTIKRSWSFRGQSVHFHFFSAFQQPFMLKIPGRAKLTKIWAPGVGT